MEEGQSGQRRDEMSADDIAGLGKRTLREAEDQDA